MDVFGTEIKISNMRYAQNTIGVLDRKEQSFSCFGACFMVRECELREATAKIVERIFNF